MRIECQFFKITENLGLPIPKGYYANDGITSDGAIILMEDLSDVSTGIPFYSYVSKEACLNYAKTLGEFQTNVSELPIGTFGDDFVKGACVLFVDLYKKYSGKTLALDPSKYIVFFKMLNFKSENLSDKRPQGNCF